MGRLHWKIATLGREHTIDILPAVLGGTMRVHLDGHRAGRLAKPSQIEPWRELDLTVDGVDVVVAAIYDDSGLLADVFVDRRFVVDGVALEDARAVGPRPLTTHEVWLQRKPDLVSRDSRPLFPRGVAGAIVALSLLTWIVGLAIRPIPAQLRLALAALLAIGGVVLMVLCLRDLEILASRAYWRWLDRDGESAARSAYERAMIGLPLLLLAGLIAAIALFGRT
jgi:hypothetical protein